MIQTAISLKLFECIDGFGAPDLNTKIVPVDWGSMTKATVTICLKFSGGNV